MADINYFMKFIRQPAERAVELHIPYDPGGNLYHYLFVSISFIVKHSLVNVFFVKIVFCAFKGMLQSSAFLSHGVQRKRMIANGGKGWRTAGGGARLVYAI